MSTKDESEKDMYVRIMKKRGLPLAVKELSVLAGVTPKTMLKRLKADEEDLSKLGYKIGRYPLPPHVVNLYHFGWIMEDERTLQ